MCVCIRLTWVRSAHIACSTLPMCVLRCSRAGAVDQSNPGFVHPQHRPVLICPTLCLRKVGVGVQSCWFGHASHTLSSQHSLLTKYILCIISVCCLKVSLDGQHSPSSMCLYPDKRNLKRHTPLWSMMNALCQINRNVRKKKK